jgi:hypothetical protein
VVWSLHGTTSLLSYLPLGFFLACMNLLNFLPAGDSSGKYNSHAHYCFPQLYVMPIAKPNFP